MIRMDIELTGELREKLARTLLPIEQWQSRKAEMPKECQDVVTGEAQYCGCEAIGYNDEYGWYLVLWQPNDEPEFTQNIPLKTGGSLAVGARIEVGPTEDDPGTLTLLFSQKEWKP